MKPVTLTAFLILSVFYCSICIFPVSAASQTKKIVSPSLKTIYQSALEYSASDRFFQPDTSEQLAFESLFADILQAHDTSNEAAWDDLNLRAENMGFAITRFDEIFNGRAVHLIIIHDSIGKPRGGGFYCLAKTADPPDHPVRHSVVQCPHARSDAFTGKLGLSLLASGEISAFFSSTMRRNASDMSPLISAVSPEDEDVINPQIEPGYIQFDSDPAHNKNSFFHAAHKVWMRHHPASLVIQLHGFKETPGDANRQFDMILSNGYPEIIVHDFFLESERLLSLCLPGYRVGVFGKDTHVLGAVTNVQGQYVRTFSSGIFWHLEMSRKFRDALMTEDSLHTVFQQCLIRIVNAYEML